MLTLEDYYEAYKYVSTNEGWALTCDPIPTMGGTTQGWLDAIGVKMNIADLTPTIQRELYLDYIWGPCKYNELNNVKVATKVFDMNINMGQYQAHLLFQRAINDVLYEQLKVDGIVGNKTIKNANFCNSDNLLKCMAKRSIDFYNLLVKKNPSNAKYTDSWLRRAKWPCKEI